MNFARQQRQTFTFVGAPTSISDDPLFERRVLKSRKRTERARKNTRNPSAGRDMKTERVEKTTRVYDLTKSPTVHCSHQPKFQQTRIEGFETDDEETWEFSLFFVQSICAMALYSNTSPEELRLEHYSKNQPHKKPIFLKANRFPSSSTITFVPTTGYDIIGTGRHEKVLQLRYQNMSQMKEYDQFSAEEIRIADYICGQKSKCCLRGSEAPFNPTTVKTDVYCALTMTIDNLTMFEQGKKRGKIQSYCGMKDFRHLSFEEIRFKDYRDNRTSKTTKRKLQHSRYTKSEDSELYREASVPFYELSKRRDYRGPRNLKDIIYYSNISLEKQFANAREDMRRKYPNSNYSEEILAFHGTPNPENIEKIAEENFRFDKLRRGVHGWGVYFSEFPEVSLSYSGSNNMRLLLCRILPGKSYQGDCKQSSETKKCGCDSHLVGSGDTEGRGKILVMFDTTRILPCFQLELSN